MRQVIRSPLVTTCSAVVLGGLDWECRDGGVHEAFSRSDQPGPRTHKLGSDGEKTVPSPPLDDEATFVHRTCCVSCFACPLHSPSQQKRNVHRRPRVLPLGFPRKHHHAPTAPAVAANRTLSSVESEILAHASMLCLQLHLAGHRDQVGQVGGRSRLQGPPPPYLVP